MQSFTTSTCPITIHSSIYFREKSTKCCLQGYWCEPIVNTNWHSLPVVQAFNTKEGKMGSGEMEVEKGVRVSEGVTVLLVSMSTAEQGNAVKRRRLDNGCERPADGPAELVLGSIHADSSKLRECSKYFATCMSGRWATQESGTPREFRLEAHTEVRFYEDCFGRMYFPYKAIENVGECIELLKVASQIGFAQVLDSGVKYLAAVTWSIEEEKQIRSFCDSGQISLDSTSDLHKRLHFGSNAREREEIHLKRTHRVLNRFLQLSLVGYSGSNEETIRESRRMFEEAFQATISGLGPGKCGKILPMVLTLVTETAEKLLLSLKKALETRMTYGFDHISNFCWLFNAVRNSNAGQVILEQILKYGDIAIHLQIQFRNDSANLKNTPVGQFEWNSMIRTIFEDILEGRLLLTTSQRLAFFEVWNQFFKIENKPDCPLEAMLVHRFILTLPHEDQEKIYYWVSLRNPQTIPPGQYDLTQAHSLWIKHLVSQPEIPADAPECSSTGWKSEPANGESSGCETALPTVLF
ncbi:hypothetical protein M758_6G174300 [Ceratodon purpureus]|nr:hypothetical protein M758_6G174300 [Ceratodon purpureus]